MKALSGFDPFDGVPPNLFVDERVKLWKEHGNVPSASLKLAWDTLAFKLNQHLKDHGTIRHGMAYRFPLETGGGKSTGLRLYFAMLGGIAGTAENCPGALISAQYIDDCDQYMNEINQRGKGYGMREPFAVAFHSKSDKRKVRYSDLHKWPFLITTQRGLTIGLIEDKISGLYWNRLPSFLEYGESGIRSSEVGHSRTVLYIE